jgi:hypothetical protein
MAEMIQQSITLADVGGAKTAGGLTIARLSRRDRLLRALQCGGGCWLAAVGAVFLPIAHFVLVPALLLAGPIVGAWQWSREERVVVGQGTCPYCEADVPIQSGALQWPLTETCPACLRSLEIRPIETAVISVR